MTRINCVPVVELRDAHLGAEYRELPRLFRLVYESALRGEQPGDSRNPTEYVLGPGHVRFFYPRLRYVADRFDQLVLECLRRNRAVQFRNLPDCAGKIGPQWWGTWTPTPAALALNRERIELRSQGMR